MKKLLILLIIAGLYLTPLYPVYAEDEASQPKPATPHVLQAKPVPILNRSAGDAMKLATPDGALKPAFDSRITDHQGKIASVVANFKDRIASHEAELKARLAVFKNKTKANLAEKINNSLKTINGNQTTVMKNTLDRLTKILDEIETKVNDAGNSGKNVDSVRSSIASARTAIQTAQTQVDQQSQNDYTINVSSESAIQSDAKASRDSLFNDLKASHELVVKAKQAVEEAFKAAKEVLLSVGASPAASV